MVKEYNNERSCLMLLLKLELIQEVLLVCVCVYVCVCELSTLSGVRGGSQK